MHRQRGLPVAEFVRDRILEIARGRTVADPAAIPADLTPLIERTFRYVYMLATSWSSRDAARRWRSSSGPLGICKNRFSSSAPADPLTPPPIPTYRP